MEKINAVITGVGGYVPNYILDNEEMSRIVDTSDEWIMQRIGVKTRHILRPEQGSGTSYLMTRAVKQLLRKTQVDPASVELVICATTTPDYHFPLLHLWSSMPAVCLRPLVSTWRPLVQVSYMRWKWEPTLFVLVAISGLLYAAAITCPA